MTTPYRNDREGLEQRLAALNVEIDQVDADVARLEGASLRRSELEREIAEIEARLARRKRLPDLDQLRIASPCDAKWSEMVGDDRVRFCCACAKHVYDVSKLTRSETEELLATKEDLPCVRLWRRTDGTLITADCPVGRRRRRFRRIVVATIGSSVLAGTMLLRWRSPPAPPRLADAACEAPGACSQAPPDAEMMALTVDGDRGAPKPPVTSMAGGLAPRPRGEPAKPPSLRAPHPTDPTDGRPTSSR